MTSIDTPASSSASGAKLYRAVWRWHFYAGLYVIPFLLMLAVTGLIILWVTAISPELGERLRVSKTGEPMRITAQADAALKAYPDGKIGQYIAPLSAKTRPSSVSTARVARACWRLIPIPAPS